MILAYVFAAILCGAFSFPFPLLLPNSNSDGDFKSSSKRHALMQQGNDFSLPKSLYGEDSSLEESKLEGLTWEDIFTPLKLLAMQCEPNCPAEYYLNPSAEDNNSARQNDDDIRLHMSADRDLMKFLKWTMVHLGPLHGYNASGNKYYPGLNMWTKLNLSGRRELPLYAEEPQYIVVRREPDDLNSNRGIPFIPPRGRKYIPNIENLLQRYDLFVPNRGKKDKIKDIFKYDDLFFPNRGKKTYIYQLTREEQKKPTNQPFVDCFTRCDDITSARSAPPVTTATTNQAVANINGLVSASGLHIPPLLSAALVSSSANAGGQHQDAAACDGAVAECQKENNVKINGFDQSVKAQIHQQQQQQYSKMGASTTTADRHRRLLSSSTAASLEEGALSFLPLIRADQVRRLQPHPIRNKQWRDY